MVDFSENLSGVVALLPEGIVKDIGSFILVLKAVGVAFIVYVCYLVVKAIMNYKRYKMLKYVDRKVGELDEKLDLVLKKLDMKVDKKISDKKKVKKKK